MSKPLWFKSKNIQHLGKQAREIASVLRKSNAHFFMIALAILSLVANFWSSQTVSYARADVMYSAEAKIASPLFEKKQSDLFVANEDSAKISKELTDTLKQQTQAAGKLQNGQFADKIYEIVGDAPIKEMVPFISQRDEKVAAFLIGIAKKESSFGLASPSKNGESCYNYWGFKGDGGRGAAMGYACFANAEEAIKIVGDRIEILVNKERNTPSRMVDTWKCGKSCKDDPGAPGWIATVALYFDKIAG
jgi:hypothetical protein